MNGFDYELIGLCVFMAFLYGASIILQKMTLNKIKQSTLLIVIGCLIGIATVIYGIYNKDSMILDLKQNGDKELLYIIILFSLTMLIPGALYFYLLSKHTPGKIAALTSITPLFVLILSYYFFKEKITMFNLIGVILIICGVALLAFK